MMVKKIVADSMGEAMERVKRELGEDAVILNTRNIKVGGVFGFFQQKKVELVATLEENKKEQAATLVSKPTEKPVRTVQEPARVRLDKQEAKVVMTTMPRLPEPLITYEQLLLEPSMRSMAEELSELILSSYYRTNDTAGAVDALRSRIVRDLKVKTPDSRYIMLVGPTGVGKTTTIAKLAADYQLNKGMKVGLITTDTYRIAAIEQLRTYAEILSIPLEVAYDAAEFETAKVRLQDCDVILVDTAGRNFRDAGYVRQLEQRHDFSGTSLLLVLSLTAKFKDIEKIFAQFRHLPLAGLIYTKADETSDLLTIFGMTDKTDLPVAWLTTGQEVPEDLCQPDAEKLAEMIIEKEGLR